MEKGKFSRRLKRIGLALRLPILIGSIFIFAEWVIEQLAGDTIVTFVKPYLTQFTTDVLPPFLNWIVNHPVSTSAILFFFILSAVIIKTYFETRPPTGLTPLLPFDQNLSEDNFIGAIIHNNTGDDLINCRCHLQKVRILKNKKWVDAEYRLPQELHWYTDLSGFIEDRINIDNGNIGKIVVAAMGGHNKFARFKITKISDEYFELQKGNYEAEIIFDGNRRDNSTVTMNFWIEIIFDGVNLLSIGGIYR